MAGPKKEKDSRKNSKIALGIIFLTAFLLRFLLLADFPFGMSLEEALLGARSQFLLNFLTDETGRKLPLFFSSFSGYDLPFASYLVFFFVRLFGLSLWSIRLGFSLLGFLGVVAFYNILKTFFPKTKIPLWATLVLAVSPWHIFLSRTTSSWCLMLNIFLLLFWLFLKAGKRLKVFLALLALGFCFMAFSYFSLPEAGQELLDNTFTFFQDKSILNGINKLRGEESLLFPHSFQKLFYNKSFYLVRLWENFSDHFKPQFYFAAGDRNPNHGLTNFGPLLLLFLPVFLFGLVRLVGDKSLKRTGLFLFLFFVFSCFFSVFSYPSLNEEKLVFAFLPITFVIGFGISKLSFKARVALFVFLFLNIGFVITDILQREKGRVWEERFLGVEKMVLGTKYTNDNYDRVFISDAFCPDPAPYFLYHRDNYLNAETNLEKGKIKPRQWINRIDNIIIGQKEIWGEPGDKKIRFIISPQELKDIAQYGFGEKDKPLGEKVCYKTDNIIYGYDNKPLYLVISDLNLNCFQEEKESE